MPKVFLGGTCNGSLWRDELIKKLKIDYFNPIVEDWNDAAKLKERFERINCDFCLYVITPLMAGVYSIAEVIDDSNKRPDKTIFCYMEYDKPARFSKQQLHSLEEVSQMVQRNGGKCLKNLDQVASYLNSFNIIATQGSHPDKAEAASGITSNELVTSILDTQAHACKVESYINILVNEINKIKRIHDKSKMSSPELDYFAKYGPMLKKLTYGSDEYKKCLAEMEKGTKHHYENNPHHPEHYKNGVSGMNLINLIEMICDWYAASRRHNNGDIYSSFKINQKRFNMSDELISILKNTIDFIKTKE